MKKIGDFLLFKTFLDCGTQVNAIVNIDAITSVIEEHNDIIGNHLILSTTDSEITIAGDPTDLWIELVEILKGT